MMTMKITTRMTSKIREREVMEEVEVRKHQTTRLMIFCINGTLIPLQHVHL